VQVPPVGHCLVREVVGREGVALEAVAAAVVVDEVLARQPLQRAALVAAHLCHILCQVGVIVVARWTHQFRDIEGLVQEGAENVHTCVEGRDSHV
jgi:hypothetical protein